MDLLETGWWNTQLVEQTAEDHYFPFKQINVLIWILVGFWSW